MLSVLWARTASLIAPGLRLMLRLRAARGKEVAERLPERFGVDPTPRPAGRLLWLHAASVGETVSILPVLSVLAEQAHVLLTTGTVTSATLLASRLPELGLQGRVLHRFVPLDVPAWAARFLDHWRPDAAGFVESELWPNLLRACRERDIPAMLVNARMSPRSFAGWSRVPGFARDVLGCLAQVQAQGEADAGRLRRLGAVCVTAPGDLKFAAAPLPVDPGELERLGALLAGRPVWLAASTHPGEDELVFAAHRTLAPAHPRLLTILVPRHPERGARIAALAGGTPTTRRAAGEAPPSEAGVWIADTLGELGLFYRLASIVFVGRSLLRPGGGQNPLEPARLGCAVAVGPHTGNFIDRAIVLEQAGALARVADAKGLAAWVDAMLRDPARREAMGRAAAEASGRYADLPRRTAEALLALALAERR
jgi:3-deoxy-D-manno-octulosonic-acid transferase